MFLTRVLSMLVLDLGVVGARYLRSQGSYKDVSIQAKRVSGIRRTG